MTRWSRTITQSDTYSSSPCRVSVPSPRSAVMTAVTPLSLSQRNRRRSSARRIAWFEKPAEQRLDRVQNHALGSDGVDGVAQPDEEPAQIELAVLVDLAAIDLDVIERDLLACHQAVEIETQRTDVIRQLFAGLLERQEDSRLAVLDGAANEELHRQQSLAAARASADERWPATWQPACRDLVQSLDAAGGLGHLSDHGPDGVRLAHGEHPSYHIRN